MKNILSALMLFSMTTIGFGQKEFDELRILYADANYEKLVKVAEKHTLDDKYKKDAMPFLWLSRGLYKIHLKGSGDAAFKNAYKESINALSKALKNDKEGTVFAETDNLEFLEEVQMSLVEQIENELSTANFRKAAGWVNLYKKASKNLVGQMYMDAACKFRADDKSTAFQLWKTADAQLKSLTSLEGFTEADKEMLKLGIMHSAECQVAIRKVDEAKKMMNSVAQYFEESDDFKAKYAEIVK